MELKRTVTSAMIKAYANLVVTIMNESGLKRICFEDNTPLYNYAGVTEAMICADELIFVDVYGNMKHIDYTSPCYWYWLQACYDELAKQ